MIVTLTTDFGASDGYAGAMKGVILSIAPRATLADITHDVPPGDVRHAAFVLAQAAEYFPPDTVHVAVVDPGVGGPRRALAVARRRQFFVGPDNGVFSFFLDADAVCRELTNPDLWLPRASATFHGRDLFAPAAAHLATGLPLAECGPAVTDPVRLPEWAVTVEGHALHAAVVHIDHFGNCVTSLPAARLAELGPGPYRIAPEGAPPVGLRRIYGDAAPGEALALVGSMGLVEIAVRDGSAAATLAIRRGTPVRVTLS